MFCNYLAIPFFQEITSLSMESSFACVLISTFNYTLLGHANYTTVSLQLTANSRQQRAKSSKSMNDCWTRYSFDE